jgi:glycosyltransferase involved in cell wall biosynthesis
MNITVFTPIAQDSEIARSTADLAESLIERGHEVAIITTERAAPPEDEREPRLPSVAPWQNDEVVSHIVGRADIVLHQLGDDPDDHVGSVRWLPELGGCVVLHAASYENLSTALAVDGQTLPFPEWLADVADAVIAPSAAGLGDIEAAGIPLAVAGFAEPGVLERAATTPRAKSSRNPGTGVRLLVVADDAEVSGDAHVDDAIVAVATDGGLRDRIELRVLSALPQGEEDRLVALARDLGVRLSVSGSGASPLLEELASADVSLHLSAPRRHAVPSSLLTAMSVGVPVVTVRGGFGSVDAEDALAVDTADLVREVLRVLRGIDAGRYELDDLAALGRARVERDFGVERVVDALLSVGALAAERKPLRELDEGFPVYRLAPAGSALSVLFEEDTRVFRA